MLRAASGEKPPPLPREDLGAGQERYVLYMRLGVGQTNGVRQKGGGRLTRPRTRQPPLPSEQRVRRGRGGESLRIPRCELSLAERAPSGWLTVECGQEEEKEPKEEQLHGTSCSAAASLPRHFSFPALLLLGLETLWEGQPATRGSCGAAGLQPGQPWRPQAELLTAALRFAATLVNGVGRRHRP